MQGTNAEKALVVFDIDGTLLELLPEEVDAYFEAFEQSYGITGINDELGSYRSPTDIGVAREVLECHFGRPCTEIELKYVLDTYLHLLDREVYGRGLAPNPVRGAPAMLSALADAGLTRLAVATGNLAAGAELRLERAGLWRYFRCGGFAEDGENKVEILEKALARCRQQWPEVIPGRVVYVGDQPSDARAAESSGVQFLGIASRPQRFERLREVSVGEIHDDYTDLDRFMGHLHRSGANLTTE